MIIYELHARTYNWNPGLIRQTTDLEQALKWVRQACNWGWGYEHVWIVPVELNTQQETDEEG